ncbi:MAG TPA: SBBP repeat-containing protein [Candidatus Angelobacter sp.]|nr:SBBP repeat-containing protein [Candidatus Angelobacter sp.]
MPKIPRFFLSTSLCLALFLTPAATEQIPTHSASPQLAFEPNLGQTAAQVLYLARSREGIVFLTAEGLTVTRQQYGNFRLKFENSSLLHENTPEQLLGSRSNYLDSRRKISVENYGAVRYRGIYPGIDVLFYGRAQHLEHDFLLSSGADAAKIVLALDGVDQLRIDESGAAEFRLAGMRLQESTPVAWQVIRGKRIPVPVQWRLLGRNRLGFSVGAYDHGHELVIDPVLAFSTHVGGPTGQLQTDQGIISNPGASAIDAVAVDPVGNIYVAGATTAVDFPLTAGSYDHTPKFPFFGGHNPDISSSMGFISKFDSTGHTLIYSTYLGFTPVKFLAVDGSGHAYALSDDGGDLTQGHGVHLNKLNPDGSALLYSFAFGENLTGCLGNAGGNATASGLAVDEIGNAWIAGSTSNLCLQTTPGAFQISAPNSLRMGFLAKLDTTKSGTASIVYSTYLGGSGTDTLNRLAVDSSGNAYVTGVTSSADFPHGAVFGTESAPVTFASKLSADGSTLLFSTLIGGGSGTAVALDPASNVYVAGTTLSSAFPTTPNALRTKPGGLLCDTNGVSSGTSSPCIDAFVLKLNATGDALIYSTLLGGNGVEFLEDLRVNAAGSAFATGFTNSPDFPLTADAFHKNLSQLNNSYFSVLSPDGGSIAYSTFLDGWSNNIHIDSQGNPYIVGLTGDWAFPVTADGFQTKLQGVQDGFLAKIDMNASGTMDTVPPVVSLNSPASGSTLAGNFGVGGTASDNVAVAGVKFTLDGKDVAPEITSPPYTATITSPALPNGPHTVSILARDAAGNVSSQSAGVIIDNPVDFSLAVSAGTPNSVTVTAGASAGYELLAHTISGLPGQISFSCQGLPARAQCNFLPKTLDLTNTGASVESVVITTTAPTAHAMLIPNRNPYLPAGIGILAALLLGLILSPGKVPRHMRLLLPATAILGLTLIAAGCGGVRTASSTSAPTPTPTPAAPPSPASTPQGTYTIMVIATATGATRTADIQLVVK